MGSAKMSVGVELARWERGGGREAWWRASLGRRTELAADEWLASRWGERLEWLCLLDRAGYSNAGSGRCGTTDVWECCCGLGSVGKYCCDADDDADGLAAWMSMSEG